MSAIPSGDYKLKFNRAPVLMVKGKDNYVFVVGKMVVTEGEHEGAEVDFHQLFVEEKGKSWDITCGMLEACGWDLVSFDSVVGKVVDAAVVTVANPGYEPRARVDRIGKVAVTNLDTATAKSVADAIARRAAAKGIKVPSGDDFLF